MECRCCEEASGRMPPPPFVPAWSGYAEGLETQFMRKPKIDYAIQTVVNAMRVLDALGPWRIRKVFLTSSTPPAK